MLDTVLDSTFFIFSFVYGVLLRCISFNSNNTDDIDIFSINSSSYLQFLPQSLMLMLVLLLLQLVMIIILYTFVSIQSISNEKTKKRMKTKDLLMRGE